MHPAKRLSERAGVLVGAVALAAGGVAAAPAAASAAGPRTTVTVLLKAPYPARLARLAMTAGDDHARRVRRLAAVLPGAAAHRLVRATLRAAGFTIGHQTAWTVDASAPASAVAATFGGDAAGPARIRGLLPVVPAGIAKVAAAALTGQGAAPLFGVHATLDGSDFRNAYAAPRKSPPYGTDANGPLTIATLQFADWNDSDLTDYAAQNNLGPDPVASGQYKQFGVSGSKLSPATQGLDEEVDLDQESLLSTAPSAKQRAYFDTNNTDGYVQALSQVLADVTQGQGKSSDGGDPHIAALSTSWGACEDDFTTDFPGDTMKAVEALLQALNAAGVTTFAASGDDGVYDCGLSKTSTKVAVDYPASSPEVVGVGGTRLTAPGGNAANDGTNWSDKGWTCTDASSCESSSGTGGSGGGESSTFPLPTYQSAGIGHDPFRTSTGKVGDYGTQPHRLVPDIAVDGDPATGFQILTSDSKDACQGQLPIVCNPTANPVTKVVGGTSLSAPVAAALLTNTLAAHGATSGVGDIHAALYSAYAGRARAFRDVTAGRNGDQSNVDSHAGSGSAAELPVDAGPGYDTVTGLGAPLWPLLTPYLFSPSAPTAHAAIRLADPGSPRHPNRVRVSWHSHQSGRAGLLASSADVTVTRSDSKHPVYRRRRAAPDGSISFDGVTGATYRVSVVEQDVAGQRSRVATAMLAVPYDSTAFRLYGTWRTVGGGNDFGGSRVETAQQGAFATATATGRRYSLLVRTGPTYGELAVFRGTHRVATLDLFTPSPGHTTMEFFDSSAGKVRSRTFTFRFTGRKNVFASNDVVDIDGLEADT